MRLRKTNMDAGDGRNDMSFGEAQYGGYIDFVEIVKSTFFPALFFVIGFFIGRLT